jgi:hypothetical protein
MIKLLPTAAVLALALSGCPAAQSAGPQETLRKYVAAIDADQPVAAYALLDEGLHRQMTQAEFVSRWRALKPELKAQADLIRAALAKPVAARAVLSYPAGPRAQLTLERGSEWKIEEGISVAPRAATPIEAIRVFIRAVEQRSYETVMRTLAKSVRENIERDITERISKLKAALNQEIEVTGNKARLQYDPKFKIELMNEDGQWKILDLD